MTEFEKWYVEMFGNILESQDEENREAIRKIWTDIHIRAAVWFEFNDFNKYTGQEVGQILRGWAKANRHVDTV